MYDETSDPVGRFQTQQTCLRPVTIKSRRIWKDCLEMEIQDKSHDKWEKGLTEGGIKY